MKSQKSKKPLLHNYFRYSSIGLQMLTIILLGVYLGLRIDGWINKDSYLFTIILSLGSVILAIYIVTKDLMKK